MSAQPAGLLLAFGPFWHVISRLQEPRIPKPCVMISHMQSSAMQAPDLETKRASGLGRASMSFTIINHDGYGKILYRNCWVNIGSDGIQNTQSAKFILEESWLACSSRGKAVKICSPTYSALLLGTLIGGFDATGRERSSMPRGVCVPT